MVSTVGMENWRLFTYRKSKILVEDKTKKTGKVEAVSTVFHEIAVSFLWGDVHK